MANRQKGFGMTAELNRKKEAKFNAGTANECLQWIKEVLIDGKCEDEAKTIKEVKLSGDFALYKDGVLLCKALNCIKPGTITKINDSKLAFKQMENIEKFLKACENIGVKKSDLFQTVDLYELNNVPQVINGILALGRKAQTIGYNGPSIGPTESTENKREFTDEQLRAGEGVIGLQAGSNKGASQAGQSFGKTRAIID